MPILGLSDALSLHVRDGQSVALEGFTHLIPFAAGHELIPTAASTSATPMNVTGSPALTP